jgi:hypothetical protein
VQVPHARVRPFTQWGLWACDSMIPVGPVVSSVGPVGPLAPVAPGWDSAMRMAFARGWTAGPESGDRDVCDNQHIAATGARTMRRSGAGEVFDEDKGRIVRRYELVAARC